MTPLIIAFAGGGTAGHVYPALEVAQTLRRRGCQVFWLGTRDGVERSLVHDAGIQLYGIPAGKLRRYLSLRNVSDIARVGASVVAAARVLRHRRPNALFAKGGFVSVGPAAAAAMLRIPIVAHESDTTAGLATRLVAHVATEVLLSSRQAAPTLPARARTRVYVTGLPVRREIRVGDAARGRALVGVAADRPLLLALGGSAGADTVNRMIRSAKEKLLQRWAIIHQTGSEPGVDEPCYRSRAYYGSDLAHLLAAADLVVSRAGATTIAELAATGTAAILLPLPRSASRGDQIDNARAVKRSGAAEVLMPDEQTSGDLIRMTERLLDGKLRASLGAAIKLLDTPDASEAVVRCVLRAGGAA